MIKIYWDYIYRLGGGGVGFAYLKQFIPYTVYSKKITPWHSGPVFQKKLQKLIILDPAHIFLFPTQGKGKIAREIRIWTEKLKKVFFQAQISCFVVLTTMTSHTKTHMGI
jgi:hypothetical protein